jgi:restriction endonuclease S subunit
MAYVQLGDICDVVKGNIGITKAIPGDYPMVTTGEFRKSHNNFQLDTKAVLIPLVSATGHGHASIKRIQYQEGKFAFGSILAACVPKNNTYSAKFLYIYFNLLKDYVLVPLMKGSANVSLTLGNLKSAKVPDISLETQLKIVELYSEIKTEQDKAIDLLSKQKDDITSLRQSILQEAVQGKLTADWRANNPDTEDASILLKRIQKEKAQLVKDKKIKKEKVLPKITKDEIPYELPAGWVWCRMQDVGLFERGKSKHRPRNDIRLFKDGKYPLIQTGEVSDAKKNGGKIKRIRSYYNDFGLAQSMMWNKGTLCITIAANIAETGFLDFDACFPDSVVGFIELIDNGNSLAHYVEYFITITKSDLEKYAPSTAQKNINLGILNQLKFPLPPLEEQKAIVQKVNTLMGLCDSLEQEVQQSQEQIAQLMQSCLREVFEGSKRY